jgi:hypothetical protein
MLRAAFATFNAAILSPSVILWQSRVGLQFGYSGSEWLLVLFAFFLTARCAWGRVAELSVLLDNPDLG